MALVLALACIETARAQAVAATASVDCTSDTACRWTFEYTVSGGDYTVGAALADNFLDIDRIGSSIDVFVDVTNDLAPTLSFLDGVTGTFSYEDNELCSSTVAWVIDGNTVAVNGSTILNKCGICVPASTPIADFEKCSDGNLCFDDGVCQDSGECLAAELPCVPTDACMVSAACTPAAGCVQVPLNCDDNNPCTIDSCSGGVCSNVLDLFAAGCTESSISSGLTASPDSPGTVSTSGTTSNSSSDDDDDDSSSSSWSNVTPWSDHETSESSDGGHGLASVIITYTVGPTVGVALIAVILFLVHMSGGFANLYSRA